MFLASSNGSADDIVQQITLPGGIKDVSYGLGHLSRTVVSATAAAQYKVGGGEWKPVAGPAGMSSAVGGFKVVEYKINRSVSTMDDAETCIADPSTWKYAPATNTAQRIAFGSGGTFDSSLYANFPAYNEDDIILVATGTIVVPTAGDWSFAVGSDDGFSARLSRLGASWAWESRGTRAYEQSAATFNLEATPSRSSTSTAAADAWSTSARRKDASISARTFSPSSARRGVRSCTEARCSYRSPRT